MEDLYAIVIKDKASQVSEIYCHSHPTSLFNRKLVFCSKSPDQLRGYIKVFKIPFDGGEKEYEVVNIQPFINSGFISRKNLSDITDSTALSRQMLEHEGISCDSKFLRFA